MTATVTPAAGEPIVFAPTVAETFVEPFEEPSDAQGTIQFMRGPMWLRLTVLPSDAARLRDRLDRGAGVSIDLHFGDRDLHQTSQAWFDRLEIEPDTGVAVFLLS